MKRQNELISIGMPIYNGETFLHKALGSILSQDYTNIEVIISDDNSTDNSLEILRTFAKKDKRIRLFNQKKNTGFANNYNFVLSKAKGEYFMWAAQDDVRDKSTLTKLHTLFQKRNDAVLAASNFQNVHGNKKYFAYKKMAYDNNCSHTDSVKRFLESDQISFLFGLYKTSVLKKTGGHHADFRPYFKSSDFLTILKVLMYGPFVYTQEVLFFKQDTGYFTKQFDVIKGRNFNKQLVSKIVRYLYSPFFYLLDLTFGTSIIFKSNFNLFDTLSIWFTLFKNIFHKFSLFITNVLKGIRSYFESFLKHA